MTETILETKYQIGTSGLNDAILLIDIGITRVNDALPGVTEEQMVQFVRGYLATLTSDPVSIRRIQTIQTDGL
jgi:hypothetical protein